MKKLKVFFIIYIIIFIFSCNKVFAQNNEKRYAAPKELGKCYYASNSNYNNELYDSILNDILSLKKTSDASRYSHNSKEVFDTLDKILNDHPEIFYFDNTTQIYFWSNGMLELKYKYDANTIMRMKNELNNKIDEILNNIIRPNMTELQKEIAIHDYIVLNTKYILDGSGLCFTSYGCIVNNEAVCDGYTRAMQILLNKVGIYAIRVVGFAGTNHAWNIVKINNNFYHVDATWDDSNSYKTNAHYKYLNVTDEELSKDHVWDRTKFPKCTDTYFKYLHKAKNVVKDNNYIYYTNKHDGNKIYKMSFDGKEDIRIFEKAATYLAEQGEWIYFSNYSQGENLYKIKKDGQDLTKVSNAYVKDLYIKDGYLYYYNINNGIEEKVKLEDYIEDKEKLDIVFNELFKGYKFWENRYNVCSNKVWTIKFNSNLKLQDLNNIVYVLDSSLNIVPNIDVKISNKSVIVKNRENYKIGSTYYLVIKNSIKNYKNINLQQPIIMKFFITY